jgi:acyl carrier protein
MNFLELFDAVVRESKLVLDGYNPPTSMDDKLADLGLDSLDFVMVFMLLGDMHGIPEDIADNPPELTTLQGAKDFIDEHKVREFDTVESAMEAVK